MLTRKSYGQLRRRIKMHWPFRGVIRVYFREMLSPDTGLPEKPFKAIYNQRYSARGDTIREAIKECLSYTLSVTSD